MTAADPAAPAPTLADLDRAVRECRAADPELFQVCLHEAGHATLAYCLGVAVRRVTVTDKGQSISGRCVHEPLLKDPMNMLVELMAGIAAEALEFPAAASDPERNVALGSDLERAQRILIDDFGWHASKNVWKSGVLLGALHEARVTVGEEAVIVRMLAVALFRRGELDQAGVEEHIALAMDMEGPRPGDAELTAPASPARYDPYAGDRRPKRKRHKGSAVRGGTFYSGCYA